MTYCVGVKLGSGLVLASDSRSNAGVDHVCIARKMHRFSVPGQRELVLLTAGNLATTQEVLSLLRMDIDRGTTPHLHDCASLFEAARIVGAKVNEAVSHAPKDLAPGVDFTGTFLLGGWIRGERPRLFLIYPEGNFIEATPETPFFQIGESKYGKPIFDRVVHTDLPLEAAIQCTLISFDSTMRSNLSVGLPIEVLVFPSGDGPSEPAYRRIEEADGYFLGLRKAWGEGLRSVFASLPKDPWIAEHVHRFED